MANLLSVLFHPVFYPAFILLWYQWRFPHLIEGQIAEVAWLSTTAAILLPLCVTAILWATGKISGLQMKFQKDRKVPLLVSVLCYYLLHILFEKVQPLEQLSFLYFGLSISLLIALVLPTVKASLHVLACGAFLAMVIFFNGFTPMQGIVLAVTWTLFTGAMGAVRLKLNAHQEHEIYLGFSLGFFPVILSLLLN